jgi:hypothetical protein
MRRSHSCFYIARRVCFQLVSLAGPLQITRLYLPGSVGRFFQADPLRTPDFWTAIQPGE